MTKRNIIVGALIVFSVMLSSFSFYFYQVIYTANLLVDKESRYVYIPSDATFKDVQNILYDGGYVNDLLSFSFLAKMMNYDKLIKPGKFLIDANMSNRNAIVRLRLGEQVPVNITFNNVRLLRDFPEKICSGIEILPGELWAILEDTTLIHEYGFNIETFKSMFLPNTYQVYWTIKPKELLDRMHWEYKRFWNEERMAKAASINMSPIEVSVLASIVQAECRMRDEAPVIAGLYINRLNRGYYLQADPTVVYANQDFTIKRVLNKHKEIDSPYNTYKYRGLPPGPINMPEIVYIEAVLNYASHKYLYMCAKSDFSGYHHFSTNLQEHNIYARKYQQALNRQGIYK